MSSSSDFAASVEERLRRAGDAMLIIEWEGDDVYPVCPWCRAERIGPDGERRGHKEDCKGDNAIYEATGLVDGPERYKRRKELLGA